MKILVIGTNGFIGHNVHRALSGKHQVVSASRNGKDGEALDLEDPASIAATLKKVHPDAIVNCAGISENSESARKNLLFTRNLLEQIVAANLSLQCIVILGSAAEYGLVDRLPVSEDAPRKPTSLYGESKKEEVDFALRFRDEYKLPIVVARIFNPIGNGMPPRMFIPAVLRQITAFRDGQTDHIAVSRLDAKRDYLDVSDVGEAISVLLGANLKHAVYNIGSGISTSNQEIIKLMLDESRLSQKPKLVETSTQPEPLIACQADISRITGEFGWTPKRNIMDTIRGVIHASKSIK